MLRNHTFFNHLFSYDYEKNPSWNLYDLSIVIPLISATLGIVAFIRNLKIESYYQAQRITNIDNANKEFDSILAQTVPDNELLEIINGGKHGLESLAEAHSKYEFLDYLILFTLALSSLTIMGCLVRAAYKSNVNKNQNQQTVFQFFKNNPIYPKDKTDLEIDCPILLNKSTSPVFISYTTKKNSKPIAHAYDYEQLKQHFTGLKSDPLTNLNLQYVENLKISFDPPLNVDVPELVKKDMTEANGALVHRRPRS